jgi:DNA mismatch endonuclease (patch repair protein)
VTTSVSFTHFKSSSTKASSTLARIKSSETKAERLLRSALWATGLRFRKNVRSLPGKPDIVVGRLRLAIFCDGDFWHGRNWSKNQLRLSRGSNPVYWTKKIASNIERDKRSNLALKNLGWTVIRVWESDVRHDPSRAAQLITQAAASSVSARDRMGRLRL